MRDRSAMNSPNFRAWLDDLSFVDKSKEPTNGCDRCGAAADSQPFFGNHCLFCVAYEFGRFEKAQEIALFAKLVVRTITNSSLNELTQEVGDINWGDVLPLANSDEARRA